MSSLSKLDYIISKLEQKQNGPTLVLWNYATLNISAWNKNSRWAEWELQIHSLPAGGAYGTAEIVFPKQRCAYKHYFNMHYTVARWKENSIYNFLKTVSSPQRNIDINSHPQLYHDSHNISSDLNSQCIVTSLIIIMFPEHQISILEGFLKDHVTLRIRVLLKIQLFQYRK